MDVACEVLFAVCNQHYMHMCIMLYIYTHIQVYVYTEHKELQISNLKRKIPV